MRLPDHDDGFMVLHSGTLCDNIRPRWTRRTDLWDVSLLPGRHLSRKEADIEISLIVMIFQTLLMASLAELCSIWPTAGGQQYVFTRKITYSVTN